ncbi:hypothetical protein QWJ26_00830 [Streptomyces sp. CSDS2]|uniref:hypothetical protein n=1 Tax=Streptomyces sp. CSDS2 TaxID=3055051 RepID=UPI0025B1523F|nr:hypothetical protein [Streptomyces sp. CSDS2]MDN3258377.1 hypothetical protein [Streptomyces sp. CSDS2]
MSTTPQRRPVRLAVGAVVLCLALVVGVVLWLTRSPDQGTDYCGKLSEDKRVAAALGSVQRQDPDCARLGRAIRQATTGDQAGVHSLRQAQAMKNVLIAVDDVTRDGDGSLDPALAVPLTEALSDYMPDYVKITAPGQVEYVRRAGDSAPPWSDDEGVHMSVFPLTLLHVTRQLADSPAAYAQLRVAATREIAEEFAGVPRAAGHERFEAAAGGAGYVLGALDAVAEDVREDLGEDGRRDWRADVFARLTKDASAPPSYHDDPSGHIVKAWGGKLRSGGEDQVLTTLETQAGEMVRAWGEGAALDPRLRASLQKKARDVSALGLHETARSLG